MDFCTQLWEKNQDLITQITEMPFIREMYTGELSDEQFYYYIEQDVKYLYNYAKAGAYLITKSETSEQMKLFLELVDSTFIEQDRIHNVYLADENFVLTGKETPANKNYSNFILCAGSTLSLSSALAGLIVCPWLYLYIGEHFSRQPFECSKYRYWFEANGAKEVRIFVEKMQNMLNQLAQDHSQYHNQMNTLFREALLLEYEFWNDAYLLKEISKIK